MKHSTIGKTFAIAAVAALALGIAPAAKAHNKGCSNATLKGTFVHTASGFEAGGPIVGVGTDTFDGNGNITGTATLNVNGTIMSANETGKYKVNPDCTGTYTVQFSGGGSTNVYFVIADSGNEIHGICTDQGTSVTTHTFRRQFPVGDWRE